MGKDRASHVHTLGETGSLEPVPELVAALNDVDSNVRRLAASALGKLRAAAAVEALYALLEREPGSQARQYALKALKAIGDPQSRPTLERIAADPYEIEYHRAAAKVALAALRNGR
jgi:HEAT repeat protein